jgi:hypothetical protein
MRLLLCTLAILATSSLIVAPQAQDVASATGTVLDDDDAGGLQNWATRSTQADVCMATAFDTEEEVYDYVHPDAEENMTWQTSISTGSTGGAIRFDVYNADGSDSGNWFRYLCDDQSLFGNGEDYYVQFRYYADEGLWRYKAPGGNGSKMVILSHISASNQPNEVVIQNLEYRAFPQLYWQDGSTFVNGFEGRSTPCNGANFSMQNEIDDGSPSSPSTCLEYANRYGPIYDYGTGSDVPTANDITTEGHPRSEATGAGVEWPTNEWITVKLHVTIGTLGTESSRVEIWIAQDGAASVKTHDFQNVKLGTANSGHNAIWLLPYDTGRATMTKNVDTFAVYDEVIVSTSDIADPTASSGGLDIPYSLPDPGETLEIGANSHYDVRPSGITTDANWDYALFNCYGGGAFVDDYSTAGAWTITNSGGHGCPRNIGAVIFDFEDETWKREDPQGGTYSDSDYTTGDTTGAPDYEITGSSGVPAPRHVYGTAVRIPEQLGGGEKGSVMMVQRAAMTTTSVSSQVTYVQSMATGDYTKQSSSGRGWPESDGVLDISRRRVWLLTGNQNSYTNLAYFDLDSDTWTTTSNYTPPDDEHRRGSAWMFRGYLFRQGDGGELFAYNPASNTWTELTLSGSMPSWEYGFAYFPPTGKFYTITDAGGTSLYRLTPPADPEDILTGTWTADTVSVSPSLPARPNDGGNGSIHTNSMFNVPALNAQGCCLAWVPGGSNGVYLVNPE